MLRSEALPSPLWILGTGTGVGKTFVAASLAREWAKTGPVTYRKPFQTGVDRPDHPEADATVLRAQAGAGVTTESGVLLKAPLAPLAAARLEGQTLDLDALARWCGRPAPGRLLLEGVGGLLVPLAPQVHFLAWATEVRWSQGQTPGPGWPPLADAGSGAPTTGFLDAPVGQACRRPMDVQRIPCLLVALGGLGTLNHTLLSAEALMLRGWRIEQVLLNPGADGTDAAVAQANAELLREFLPMPIAVLP